MKRKAKNFTNNPLFKFIVFLLVSCKDKEEPSDKNDPNLPGDEEPRTGRTRGIKNI